MTKPRNISIREQLRPEIVRLYESGLSTEAVARDLGIGASTVGKALKEAGIVPAVRGRATSGGGSRIPQTTKAAMVEAYLRGDTLAAIAKRFGTWPVTVRKTLVDNGVALRDKHTPFILSEEQQQTIPGRYLQGESQEAIAQSLGVSQGTISRVLRRANVASGQTRRERHGNWKGGKVKQGAYSYVLVEPGSKFAGMAITTGYVAEHRLVMAESLGRPLDRSETVHHINGDKMDNRLENLQLRQGRHGKGARFTCQDCGSHNIVASELD